MSVTCEVADLVGSSIERAVTDPVPGVRLAIKRPVLSMVPIAPVVVQVTPCVEWVSVARNRALEPTLTVIAEGLMVTTIAPVDGGGAVVFTVTSALADLVESCIDAAVTVPCPAVTAVNMPLALMVPSAAGDIVQATPTVELTTVGVNCTVPKGS